MAVAISGGIAVDGSGNLWVTDYPNNRVEEFNSSGTFLTGLGAGYNGVSGSVGSSGNGNGQFNEPQYIHFDSSGNIYVSELQNSRVQKFNSSGTWQQTIGSTIAGYGTMSGVDDFGIDACANVWIEAKTSTNVVEVDYAGNYVSSFTDTGGVESIGIDSTGKIYVLDETSDVVNIYNSSGTLLSTIGSSGSGNGQFNYPQGLILIGSAPTRLPLSGCPAVVLAAAGPPNGTYVTSNTLGFSIVYDQAVTVTGTPYVQFQIGANARTANYISGSGTTTLTFQYTVVAGDNAQPGTGISMTNPFIYTTLGTVNSNSIASDVYFQPPTLTSVLVNPVGYSDFYIADTSNHAVRKVTQSTGFISTVAGTGTSGNTNDNNNSAATSARLNAPQSVALDGSSNLYIADSGNHDVLKVTAATGKISIVAGTGTTGATHENDGSLATVATLAGPKGVALDSSNNIYIADSTNHVVVKVTNATGIMSYLAGTGATGATHENDGSLATAALLAGPSAVAVDSSNNVYIADGTNHVVLKVTAATGKIAYFAGTGATGSTHENDGSLATAAKLKTPSGVAVDSSGNVYIADGGNDVILEVAAATGKISIVTGTVGTASYSGDGGAATSATVSAAKGVAVDASGNVYIADTGNNLVRWIITTFGDINPLAGNGTGGYTGDGAAATSGEINAPAGIAVGR